MLTVLEKVIRNLKKIFEDVTFTYFLYKKEMDLRLSPLMIVIGRFKMDL